MVSNKIHMKLMTYKMKNEMIFFDMKMSSGKQYKLKSGVYDAYKRNGVWRYVNDNGVEKRCGKHSGLKQEVNVLPMSPENLELAKEFLDSWVINHCYGMEAPDSTFKYNKKVDYVRTLRAIDEEWKRTGYNDVELDLDIDPLSITNGYVRISGVLDALDTDDDALVDAYWAEFEKRFEESKKKLHHCIRFV